MPWPTENIPSEDKVFKRIPPGHCPGGVIAPIAFKDPELSVNWNKYATAEQTKNQAAVRPERYGVVSLSVGNIREMPSQQVNHRPLNENQAHSQVEGQKDEEIRLKLCGLSHWEIQTP